MRSAAMNASAIIAACSGSTRSYSDSDMSTAPTPSPSKQQDEGEGEGEEEDDEDEQPDSDTRTHTQSQLPPGHKKVGDHLLIEEEGCFFPCVVLEVVDAAQGVWLVHYLGWDHIRDEKVGGASSPARILPDTPAHRLLCDDLEAQIRRIQRKGSQLPRGDTKLVVKNKVVDAVIVETAIRQPEKGTAVTTMHYITFESLPARDGWYDQEKLRLAPAWSVSGSAAPAVRQRAGSTGKGGAKKARGMSAKAHLLDERRDAALKRLGSPPKLDSSAGTGRRADGARDAGGCMAQTARTETRPTRPEFSSTAVTAEDAQLCTWVWYWSGARSDPLPHNPSRKAKGSGSTSALRWVETSLTRQTDRKRDGEGGGALARAKTEVSRFSPAWLRQHVEDVKSQTFPGAKVFLKRNSLNACQRILAATAVEDQTAAIQRSHPQRSAIVAKGKSAVTLPEAERDRLAALQAKGRKRPNQSVTVDQAASSVPDTGSGERTQACEVVGKGSKPKKTKHQGTDSETASTELAAGATAAAAAVPSPATNRSMAIHHIAPALDIANANGEASTATSSQMQPQGQSANGTSIPVSSLMVSSSGSPSAPPSSGANADDSGEHAVHLHDGNVQPDLGNRPEPIQPAQIDRQWSVAEETRLADLVSKYWPLIIDEAQTVGSPILPRESRAWVQISAELGTIVGSNTPLHSPESCNKHWTAVAKQMQTQQEAQERQQQEQQEQQKKQEQQQQEQRRRAMEQQEQQRLMTQQRDQLYFEQQQIVLSEIYTKIVQQQETEKQQQQLALQQQTQQYQNAIAHQQQQQQQLMTQCGGQANPLQQQQLQQNQQLLLLQLQQQQLQQQQMLEQQHQHQLQQHQQLQAQSQRPLTSLAVASVLVEGHPSNVIGSLRVVYPLLHKMLRESGFGSNVLPLMGCHGQLMVKVSFSFRTPTPSAVKESEPLVFTMKGAPWLRAMLYQNGVMTDCGFSWSPPDWLDLIETLQQLSSVAQQQSLADGLREALWRRDGRRRTYFCCLLRHPVQQQQALGHTGHIQGCGTRLLDQNELRQHIAKAHAHPAVHRHSRIMLVEMQVQRRKQLSVLWAQQNVNGASANARNIEDDNAWVISKTEELLTRTLPSENLESFRARVKALRLQEGEAVDDDDDCMLAYERVSVRDGTTMTKMTCPGRTRRCKHLQCFDLRSHVQEAYRKRIKWAATGGPPRDADLPGTNLVTCAVSACAMEVDVSELVKDEYFAAVLGALEQQGVESEQVDVDPSVGNWRPSPVERNSNDRSAKPAALSEGNKPATHPQPGSTLLNTQATADEREGVAAKHEPGGTQGSTGSRASSATQAPGMKTEADPNAPTFYDLT